ncbi:unnamed protein product [Cuscuta epithymum]|uniref:Pentatricopeptide repeat-containing protein-mitochondrial domain-containing protein n=1 Tax=Cuscuta epithymum TaxID=186058 RepID=A0AAV0DKW7_9ASTE|nr:unnamed protein product [Cuscuta epithymum]
MRNHWRLILLLRSAYPNVARTIYHSRFNGQLGNTSRCISSAPFHFRAHHIYPFQTSTPFRCFSTSDLAGDHNGQSDPITTVYDIFSKADKSNVDIRLDLESNGIAITHDLVLRVLRSHGFAPESARRFFDWVSENDNERLSSKSYNLLLGVLVNSGNVNDFWEIVNAMKKKGYGVSKGAFSRALGKFEKEGLVDDIQKLNHMYASGSTDNSTEKVVSRICKIIRQNVIWDDNLETQLRGFNYTSDLVSMVLMNLENEINKGMIFFRWIEESGSFKHDGCTFNAMVRVLGKEGSTEKFWRVMSEMKDSGYEMETSTYLELFQHFTSKKMIRDAVELYAYAMSGVNKPSLQDCTFLLKKIIVSKDLDMDLFSQVLRVFKESGNTLTKSTLDAILKSLSSTGRWDECNKILTAIKNFGLLPNESQQSKIAYSLSLYEKSEEVTELLTNMDSSDSSLSYRAWASLVEGYCEAGNLCKASEVLEKMIGKEGPACAGNVLESLVSAYCCEKKTKDVFGLVKNLVNEKGLHPPQSTYKLLAGKLLIKGYFSEALEVLHMMKNHGYPPCISGFIKYLSKYGSAEDALKFSKAMTVKKFPSKTVILNLFEAYFKAGRQNTAQDFLAKCPKYIRDNADVLNLFYSMKRERSNESETVAVAA